LEICFRDNGTLFHLRNAYLGSEEKGIFFVVAVMTWPLLVVVKLRDESQGLSHVSIDIRGSDDTQELLAAQFGDTQSSLPHFVNWLLF
jgi:hypothetical protein